MHYEVGERKWEQKEVKQRCKKTNPKRQSNGTFSDAS
jgi:hypothetical protein